MRMLMSLLKKSAPKDLRVAAILYNVEEIAGRQNSFNESAFFFSMTLCDLTDNSFQRREVGVDLYRYYILWKLFFIL